MASCPPGCLALHKSLGPQACTRHTGAPLSTPTPTVAHLPAARVLQAEVLPAAPQALAALGEHGSAERCSRRDGLAGRRQLVTGVRMLCQTEMTAAVLPMNLWACFGLRRDYLGSEPAFCLRELAAGGQEILLARFTQPAKGAPAGAEQGSSFTPGQNATGMRRTAVEARPLQMDPAKADCE